MKLNGICGRAPQGARGLKLLRSESCLSRYKCRAPQGARGLKLRDVDQRDDGDRRRAPQGARGLKFHQLTRQRKRTLVAPRKGRVG